MPERATRDELGNVGYEIFIMALSCLSIVNLILLLPFMPPDAEQDQVILMIDGLLTVMFLGDFTYRLVSAESFRAYFVRERGWLDLLGSLRLLRVFRIFRVLRVGRLMRQYGFGRLFRWVTRERAQRALYVVVFLFHGDNGAGLGASHQTGWTGAVAKLIQLFAATTAEEVLDGGTRPVTTPYRRSARTAQPA